MRGERVTGEEQGQGVLADGSEELVLGEGVRIERIRGEGVRREGVRCKERGLRREGDSEG